MKKYLVLAFFTIGLALWDACIGNYPCNCPEELPYFNYRALHSDIYLWKGNLKLRFQIFPDSLEYTAALERPCRTSWTTAAYGCDCLESGYWGAKVSVDSFTITADKPFSADTPAGASLAAYFKVAPDLYIYQDSIPITEMLPLNQVPATALKYNYAPVLIGLVKAPDSIPNEGFIFTITAHRNDGTTASLTTGPTGW